jgi:uncharacterized protein (TIGR03437 family)
MNSRKWHTRLGAWLGVVVVLAGAGLISSCCYEVSVSLKTQYNCLGIANVLRGFGYLIWQANMAESSSGSGSVRPRAAGTVYASTFQRQADGSFTQLQYLASAPYTFLGSVPNAQSALSSGGSAGPLTFKNPAGWKFLADRVGVPAQSLVFGNLLGNGTTVGLALVPAGFDGGPNATSLMVQVFNPDGSTKSSNFYAVPANPVGILVADLNHDGKDDVIVTGENSNTATGWTTNSIAVYLGNGDGTLQAPVYYSGNQGTSTATLYDFNGDGNLDLAVANLVSGDVSILLGRGNGTFQTAVNYTAIAHATSIVAGDFNGDGHPDLAIANATSIAVLPGKGDGTFGAAIQTQGLFTSIVGLAAGDFNKDGKLDLAVSDNTNATVSILLGDGTGKFPAENDYAAGYGVASSSAVGNIFAMDLDGDGNLDVVAGSGHPDVLTATPYLSDAVVVLFGRGDGTLNGPPAYRVGTGMNTVAVADFNGDGKPDIAAASGSLWVLLSSGGGNFKTPVSISLGSGVSADGLAVGDLNGDGKQDLVVGDFNGSGIYVLLGNGDGTFQAPVHYPVGGKVTSIAIADFNGDGKPDIAVCGASYNTGAIAGVLLGNGNGTFQAIATLSGTVTPVSLAVGDFNGDGKPDLAIVDQGTWPSNYTIPSGGGVAVYLNKGNGAFQSPVNYTAGIDPAFIVAADVNGDHNPDLIVATLDPNWNTNGQSDVAVLMGKGNGTFQPASYNITEEGPNSIAAADFNGDGKLDLAIGHCCNSTFATVMFGNGDGTFQAEGIVPSAYSPFTVAAADLNGDGKPDLIAGLAQNYKSQVGIFLNYQTASAVSIASNGSAANYTLATVAPGSIATAFGANLATATAQPGGTTPPTTLGGTSVTIQDAAGAGHAAPLFYVSPAQVNYEVPDGTAIGNASVTVTSGSGQSGSVTTPVAAVAPGVFPLTAGGLAAAIVLVVAADNSQSFANVYQVDASGNVVPSPLDLSAGQVYLEIYGTGIHNAKNVTVTIGGQSVTVLWVGPQGAYPGLDQINVGPLPASLKGKGQVNIAVSADGQSANATNITVK